MGLSMLDGIASPLFVLTLFGGLRLLGRRESLAGGELLGLGRRRGGGRFVRRSRCWLPRELSPGRFDVNVCSIGDAAEPGGDVLVRGEHRLDRRGENCRGGSNGNRCDLLEGRGRGSLFFSADGVECGASHVLQAFSESRGSHAAATLEAPWTIPSQGRGLPTLGARGPSCALRLRAPVPSPKPPQRRAWFCRPSPSPRLSPTAKRGADQGTAKRAACGA